MATTQPCNNCAQPPKPCLNCDDVQDLILTTYCNDGCVDPVSSDCVYYAGESIVDGTVNILNRDTLTKVIQELVKNANDVNVDITFNQNTRQFCLLKNGSAVKCVTIPDTDDEYLVANGTVLEIWKPIANGTDILINSVDLLTMVPETQLTMFSSSLTVTNGGVYGHSPRVELQPSTDTGNGLILGSDGKPFVAVQTIPISNVNITNSTCLTWAKTFVNGIITYTPTIDWQCVADQVCPLCATACGIPSNLNVQTV